MTSIITFSLYLCLVAIISWWAYRNTRQQSDYFLGGRQLSPAAAALSAGASDMSGWLLLGLPGYALASGLESIWLSTGLCIGLAVCWITVAKRLRVYTEFLDNALTIPAYLQRRFDEKRSIIKIVTACMILFFFLFYVSSGFVAGAKLFSHVFSASYMTGAWLSFIFVVAYTFVGGFLAVSWTDVLQGLLMLLALLIAPVMVIAANNGVGASLEHLSSTNPALLNPFTNAKGEALGWISIVSLLGWGLGYFGQPHILARFKALSSDKETPTAATIAISWSILVNVGAIAVGLVAVLAFSSHNISLGDTEQVFIVLANTLFHPVIAGVVMAAILAAIMSTADSQLLVCSSALAEDLMGLVKKEHTVSPLLLGRIGVLVIGMLALWVAMDPENQVLEIVSYAWAGLGAAFGPVILISLYSQRVSHAAAVAGILVGGISVIIWKQLSGGIFDLYELVPGFVFSTVVILVVTQFTSVGPSTMDKHNAFLKKLA